MVKSMTGYGRARETLHQRDITVEVRSVNNRFLDCTVKMPRAYVFAEDAVKARVRAAVSRGKVDVFVTIDASAADVSVVTVNQPLQQTVCLITMFRLYAQFPEAVNWPRMSVLILLFAVSDVALFCLIGQTARKAELETANRLLNDQLDNQLKHYSALVDQYEDNRRIRHDIAHHMHTIQLLLESDRRQEATAYAGELMRQQEHSSQLGQCENPLVDAFLFSRIREARQAGIPVEASVVLPRRLPIANVDLVILFGNLMDNAVEACGQVASPFIRLEAGLRKDYLVVTETNPAPADDTRKKRRIPQLERGIGLHILTDLAGRYHGSCIQEVRDGQFTVSIALQLPENQGETGEA